MTSPDFLPVSIENCWMAESICRMLLMQAVACDLARECTKLGMAMAANKPMMATTIIISTNVKPAWLVGSAVFILCCSFLMWREQHDRRGYDDCTIVH